MKEGFKIVGIPVGVSLRFFEPDTENLGTVFDAADNPLVQPILFDVDSNAIAYYHGQYDVVIGGTDSAADIAWNGGLPQVFPRQTGVDLSEILSPEDRLLLDGLATDVTFDPTGFIDNTNIDITYDKVARTITLTHPSGFIVYKWRGLLKSLASPWTSTAHPVGASRYFLDSSDGDAFTWGTAVWSFRNVHVAVAFPLLGFAVREPHGVMQHETHTEAHDLLGTYRVSGLGPVVGSYTEGVATDAAVSPSFAAGIIKDEDSPTYINATAEGLYTTMRIAAGGVATFDTAATLPFRSGGSYIFINDPTTGAETAAANLRFVNVYEILIPVASDTDSQKFRRVFLQPQTSFASLAAAQAEDTRGLNLGDFAGLAPEFVFYARITYSTLAGNANTGKVTIPAKGITYVVGTRTSQLNVGAILQGTVAENVAATPHSDIAATTVQGQLEEIAAERVENDYINFYTGFDTVVSNALSTQALGLYLSYQGYSEEARTVRAFSKTAILEDEPVLILSNNASEGMWFVYAIIIDGYVQFEATPTNNNNTLQIPVAYVYSAGNGELDIIADIRGMEAHKVPLRDLIDQQSALTQELASVLGLQFLAPIQSPSLLGQYNTAAQLTAGESPATVNLDYATGNHKVIDRVTNNPASFTITESNRPTGTGKAALLTVTIKCGTNVAMTLPAGYPAVVLVASKTNKFNLSSYYDHHAGVTVYQSKHLGSW